MQKIHIENLIIYKAVYEYINSNMYIILSNDEAVIIDPNENQEVLTLLNENKVKKITILLTHEHPDHVSGINLYQRNFKSTLICTKFCAEFISKEENLKPTFISFVLQEKDRENGTEFYEKFKKEFQIHTYKADITFENTYNFRCGIHNFALFNILGHSQGSCVIILDNKCVFTGDTLLKGLPVITGFKGGNKQTLINQTLPFLNQKLNKNMFIFPGHGECFKLNEIMKDNKIYVELR